MKAIRLKYLAVLVLYGSSLFSLPLSGQGIPVSSSSQSPAYPPGFHYENILPQLRSTFKGTIHLPKTFLEVGRKYPAYPRLLTVSADSYELIFTPDKDEPCEGEHRCTYGRVTASGHPGIFDTPAQKVRLVNGTQGDFYKMSCGSYCGEATLEWREGETYYTIGIKAGERKDLIEAVNSAIKVPNQR